MFLCSLRITSSKRDHYVDDLPTSTSANGNKLIRRRSSSYPPLMRDGLGSPPRTDGTLIEISDLATLLGKGGGRGRTHEPANFQQLLPIQVGANEHRGPLFPCQVRGVICEERKLQQLLLVVVRRGAGCLFLEPLSHNQRLVVSATESVCTSFAVNGGDPDGVTYSRYTVRDQQNNIQSTRGTASSNETQACGSNPT